MYLLLKYNWLHVIDEDMRVLCVAEKNAISKSVAGSLSRGSFQTRDSKNKYVKNYSFKFTFPQWGECDVVMTAVAGHLTNKQAPQGYGWGECLPEQLFTCPLYDVISSDDNKKISENIINLARNSDKLMIWTDCDREGEYIGWEILSEARKGNSSFDLNTTLRAKFSHLESSHIYHAACNPIKLDKRSIDAVNTRLEVDFRTGYCFTRYLTDLMRNKLKSKENDKTLVSYGNCQFPTLGFVVDRFKRIKYFKTEEFWYISITLKKGITFTWDRGRLFDRLLTICIYQDCIINGGDKFIVKDVKNNITHHYAPLPLTTVDLQKDCSRFFRYGAKETLDIAEKLYTSGLISYPRTETDSFPNSMNFKKYIEIQKQSNDWGEYAQLLLNPSNNRFRIPRKGKNNDEAHPPIHPVSFPKNELRGKEKQIYEYIVRRYLACCSTDAVGSKSTIQIQWGKEFFSTSGLVVLEQNFLEIYTYSKWESSNKELPNIKIGEHVKFSNAKIISGKTSPPQPLTETELIALMDVNGIGTDATIAEHIEKIINRGYITKVKKGSGKSSQFVLQPTILGYGLADGFGKLGFEDISLTKPFLRIDMENNLKCILNGSKDKKTVIQEILKIYEDSYHITRSKSSIIVRAYEDALRHTQEA